MIKIILNVESTGKRGRIWIDVEKEGETSPHEVHVSLNLKQAILKEIASFNDYLLKSGATLAQFDDRKKME